MEFKNVLNLKWHTRTTIDCILVWCNSIKRKQITNEQEKKQTNQRTIEIDLGYVCVYMKKRNTYNEQ